MKNIVACILLAAGTMACAQAKNLAGDVNAAASDADKAAKEAEAKAATEKAAAEADAAAKLAASLDDALATNAKLAEGALLIDVRTADKATDMLATAKNIPAGDWDKHQADFDTLTGGDKASAELGKAKASNCAACHSAGGLFGPGAIGVSGIQTWPNLAGQNAEYLANTLKSYQDGTRTHAVMTSIAKALSTADIDHLAAFYASASCKKND